MLTWDDLAMTGPVKVYDKGVVREPYYQDYGEFHLLAREGDVTIPRVPLDEPLKNQARQFVEAVRNGALTVSDGQFGLDVTRVLVAIQKSLEQNGAPVAVEYGRA
jgi:predicted dehydrogenase